jgi:hypothetical protein
MFLECLAAFALVTVALVFACAGGAWLPQLTFLALAAYRLLPSLQQLFAGLVTVRAHREVLFRMLKSVEEEVHRALRLPCRSSKARLRATSRSKTSPFATGSRRLPYSNI